jgi:hypothetical protein
LPQIADADGSIDLSLWRPVLSLPQAVAKHYARAMLEEEEKAHLAGLEFEEPFLATECTTLLRVAQGHRPRISCALN